MRRFQGTAVLIHIKAARAPDPPHSNAMITSPKRCKERMIPQIRSSLSPTINLQFHKAVLQGRPILRRECLIRFRSRRKPKELVLTSNFCYDLRIDSFTFRLAFLNLERSSIRESRFGPEKEWNCISRQAVDGKLS